MTVADADGGSLELTLALVTEAEAPAEIGEDDLTALAASVLAAEGATGCWEVTVALVRDERLRSLHRDFMGVDSPTDIMTFPADDDDECRGGDLVISMDHAWTRAGDWGLSPADEVRFLVVHGLMHLLGWRDESSEERERMLARQQALFDSWRRGG